MLEDSEMTRHVRLLITGRVQGVFFRQSTKQKATGLGIVGTVSNLSDGRVEIYAAGEASVMTRFIEWCHKGPIAARVDNVELIELDGTPAEYSAFSIV